MKESTATHIRRCHICEAVTEKDGALVSHCGQCGKPMAPFYFFNEADVQPYSEHDLRPPSGEGDRTPIRGLTAFW